MECLNIKTPYYVFDIGAVREKVQWVRQCLGNQIQLCFSVKANSWIIPYIIQSFDYFEVCSIGELFKCREYNIPESKIIWGGILKTPEDIHYAARLNLKYVSIESMIQLEHLQNEKLRIGGARDVLLRVTSGNQFGLEEIDILDIVKQKNKWPNLNFSGIHYYSGTQKGRSDVIREELLYLEQLNKTLGLQKLEYGPGIMIPYYASDDPQKGKIILKEISSEIKRISQIFDVGRC